jgi:hypothetical protein
MDEVRRLRTSDDPTEYVAHLGAMLAALVQVASSCLDGWAAAAETDSESLIAVMRRINEIEIAKEGQ